MFLVWIMLFTVVNRPTSWLTNYRNNLRFFEKPTKNTKIDQILPASKVSSPENLFKCFHDTFYIIGFVLFLFNLFICFFHFFVFVKPKASRVNLGNNHITCQYVLFSYIHFICYLWFDIFRLYLYNQISEITKIENKTNRCKKDSLKALEQTWNINMFSQTKLL